MITAEIIPSRVQSPGDVETTPETVFAIEGSTHNGRRLALQSSRILVGSSSECTLRLVARGVAPYHCLIIRGRERTIFHALNGHLEHNGQAAERGVLNPGDTLAIGPVKLRFARGQNGLNCNATLGQSFGEAVSHRGEPTSRPLGVDTQFQSQAALVADPHTEKNASQAASDEISQTVGWPTLANDPGQNGSSTPGFITETVWNPCGFAEWHYCLPEWNAVNSVACDDPSLTQTANLTAIEEALGRLELLADRFAESLSAVRLSGDRLAHLVERLQEWIRLSTESRSLTVRSLNIAEEGVEEQGEMSPVESPCIGESSDAVQAAIEEPQIGQETVARAAIVDEQPGPIHLDSKIGGKDLPRCPESTGRPDGTLESIRMQTPLECGPGEDQKDEAPPSLESCVGVNSPDEAAVEEGVRRYSHYWEYGVQISPCTPGGQEADNLQELDLSVAKDSEDGAGCNGEASPSSVGHSESGDHERAVREYMRELLSRLRLASGRGESENADMEGPEPSPQAVTAREMSPTKTRRPPAPNPLSRPRGARRRAVAPEKNLNFAAMRELANLASQAAIDRYARAKLHQAQRSKAAVVLTAIGAAAAIFALDWLWGVSPLGRIAFFVSILVALVYGIQYAVLTGKLIINPRGQLQLAERRIGREMRKLVPPQKPLLPEK